MEKSVVCSSSKSSLTFDSHKKYRRSRGNSRRKYAPSSMFSLHEQIILLKSNLWHLGREESRIRRKMQSIVSKLDQNKKQLRDFISLAKEEQLGTNSHLERLNNAEKTIREQLDAMCTPSENMTVEDVSLDYSHIRRRQKQISKALLDVVHERNALEQKLSLAHAASRIIQTLLEEDWNERTVEMIRAEIKENPEIEKTAKKYMEIRDELERTRDKLIALLKRREYTKQALSWAKRTLHYDDDAYDNGSDSSESFESLARDFDLEVRFSDEKLRNILVKLCENIRASGLIRQRRRQGRTYPLVFVGSELVTWGVKSDIADDKSNIASDRVEGRVLGKMLVQAGLVYAVDESQPEFRDSFVFYRFRCDDSAIRHMTKTGWLTKHGRFRSKRRFYVWDSERQQLFEHKTKDDTVPLYRYPFEHGTDIRPSGSNESVFDIIFTHPQRTVLRLKAASGRERDSWIRVLTSQEGVANKPSGEVSVDDPHYEEFRYLRAKNRLKWSSLYVQLQDAQHEIVEGFRKFIAQQARLDSCDKRMLQSKLNFMFEDTDNPIGKLFQQFADIFLEPFQQIDVDSLHKSSVDAMLTLCSGDLQSFLLHSHSLILHLLTPESVEVVTPDSRPRNPTLKALNRYLKQTICSHLFSHGVYSTLFPLYQKTHAEVDRQLQDLVSRYHCLRARDFKVSPEFCVDDNDPLPENCDCHTHENDQKQSEVDIMNVLVPGLPGTPPGDLQSLVSVGGSSVSQSITSPESSSAPPPDFNAAMAGIAESRVKSIEEILREASRENETRSRDKGGDSAMDKLWGSSSRLNSASNRFSYPPAYDRNSPRLTSDMPPPIEEVPKRKWAFDACLDKMAELRQYRSPRDKLRCLIQLKDLICRCIDERVNEYDSSDSDEDMVSGEHDYRGAISDADSSVVVGQALSSNAPASSNGASSMFTATTMNTSSTDPMSISSLAGLGIATRTSSVESKFAIESVPEDSSIYEETSTPVGRTCGIVGDEVDHSIASVLSVMSVESEMSDVWGMTPTARHSQELLLHVSSSNLADEDDSKSAFLNEKALSKVPTVSAVPSPKRKKRRNKKKRNKEMLIDGSDILALFALCICRSRMGSINAEIAFMEDFMNDEEAQMKSGYYLTVLRACTAALLNGTLP